MVRMGTVLYGPFWNPFNVRYISDLSALKTLLAFWSEWQVVGVMIYGAIVSIK